MYINDGQKIYSYAARVDPIVYGKPEKTTKSAKNKNCGSDIINSELYT